VAGVVADEFRTSDVNGHPVYIGQAPAYATAERAATCAISKVGFIKSSLTAPDVLKMALDTSHYGVLGSHVNYLHNNTCCQSPLDSVIPRNAFAYLTALKTVFGVGVNEIGASSVDGSHCLGFSIGLVLKSSILMRNKDDFILFGKDAVSFGVYFDGTTFDIRCSKTKRRTQSPLPRLLQNGDEVTLSADLKTAILEIKVTGPGMSISKKFGLAADVSDPGAYLLGVSLGAGHSTTLKKIELVSSAEEVSAPSISSVPSVPVAGPIVAGSRVRIRPVSASEAEAAQESHGGWCGSMASCLGGFGTAEAVRSEVWRVRMESSSDNYVWNEALLEPAGSTLAAAPSAVVSGEASVSLTADGRIPIGAKVVLTPDYTSYSDASGGPLKVGDIGTLVTDDRGSKPYKVEFNGKTWWYECKAIMLSLQSGVSTDAAPVVSADKCKPLGTINQFDIGFGLMEKPMSTFMFGACDVGESIGIIGAICRISQLSLKNRGTSGLQRVLSHDVLGPLLRLSFLANSSSIRIASTKAVCLLLPYSSPDIVSTSLKSVFSNAFSFIEFALERVGAQLNPFLSHGKFNDCTPLAFTETYQLQDMLSVLFSGTGINEEWNNELKRGENMARCSYLFLFSF
jgi:hypothetical protein